MKKSVQEGWDWKKGQMEQGFLHSISDKILLSLVTAIRKLNTSTKLNFNEKSCAKIFSFCNKLRLNLCGGKIKKGGNGRNEKRKGAKCNETRLQWMTESEELIPGCKMSKKTSTNEGGEHEPRCLSAESDGSSGPREGAWKSCSKSRKSS